MRLLGIARQGLNIFCGWMVICQGVSKTTYDGYVRSIHSVSMSVFDVICKKVVTEEKDENVKQGRSPTDLKISGDGL